MKHASEATLLSLSAFLEQIRAVPGLKEMKAGVFYWKSRAFLHFHEDRTGVYADVRLHGSDFDRFPVITPAQQRDVLGAIRKVVIG